MFVLMTREVPNLPEIKSRFQIIMDDYKVEPKETALVVYTEGKNEYFIKRFLLAKAVAGCSNRTLKFYDTDLRFSLQKINKDADEITSLDIQVYLAKRMQQVSLVTVDNHRRCFSAFYNWLYREELITTNPMKKVDKLKLPKKQKPAFTEMEVEKIRCACRTTREKMVVELLLSTGCRVSEVVNIKICDIKADGIDVLGKGGKHRIVYLNARAQLAVSNYLAERKDANPYLLPRWDDVIRKHDNFAKLRQNAQWYKNPKFVSADGHMDPSSLGSSLRNIGHRAGVEKVHAHRFRRTCATFALRRGMPIEQVSKMLGHEQINTTQVYLDLTESELAYAHSKYVV